MSRRHLARSFTAAAAVFAVAGCGSTVANVRNLSGGVGTGLNGPSGSAGASQLPVTSGGPAGSAATTVTATGAGRANGGATGTAAGSSVSQTPAVAPSLVAAKKQPVRIGFTTLPDAAAFFSSFGASTSTGDQNVEIQAAVAWVNAHGGLDGHPIEPKIEALSATSSQSYDSQYQALCAKYTQDDHVIAATILPTGANDNMDDCMTRAHTLFVTGSNTLHNPHDYQQHPYVVSPSEVTITALAKTMTSLVLQRQAVVRGGNLGLINYDIPEYDQAVDQYVKPMLSAAGVGLTQYTIPPPSSTPDIGNSVSVDESAELKMKAQGIKTVMFLCSGCLAFFAEAAKEQQYHPSYVFSSLDTPVAGNDATLFTTSFGVGFSPVTQDQYVYNDPKAFASNPTFNVCKKIETAAGQASSTTSLAYSVALCDAVMSIYNAARANPAEPVTSDSLLHGMLDEGGRFPSALSFSTDLSPQAHAGAATYRPMQWSTACGCLAYYGPTLTFPPV